MRSFGGAPLVAFVCECTDEQCHRAVTLAPSAFLTLREHGDPVLFPGHTMIADAPLAAELAATSPSTGAETGSAATVAE